MLQNHGPISLGTAGGSLGYGGIPNAVAVEFDTWYDAELRDPYENHIAILTRGERQLRPEHSNHLGVCIDVPDFADGEIHRIRLDYDPVFHADIVSHVSFQAEDGIRDSSTSRGLGDVYKRQIIVQANPVYLAVCEVWYIDTYPQMV